MRTRIAPRRLAVHPTFAAPLADAFPVLSDAMETTIVETVSVRIFLGENPVNSVLPLENAFELLVIMCSYSVKKSPRIQNHF